MNILVTGASGFIGSHLVEFLRNNTLHNVYGVYRKLEQSINDDDYILPDLTNFDSVADMFAEYTSDGIDLIFHLAANPNTRPDTNNDVFSDNVNMTKNIARLTPSGTTLVFASSVLVYGNYAEASEFSRIKPETEYALSKSVGEEIVKFYAYDRGFRYIIPRICATVGPNMTHGMLYHWLQKLDKSGDVFEVFGKYPGYSKPFIHVERLCDYLLRLTNKKYQNTIMNLAPSISPKSCSVDLLARTTLDIMCVDKKIKFMKDAVWKGDHSIFVDSNYMYREFKEEFSAKDEFMRAVIQNAN